MGGGGSQSNTRIRERPPSSRHKFSISQFEDQNIIFGKIAVFFSNQPRKLGIVRTSALRLPKVATCDLLFDNIPIWSVDAGDRQGGEQIQKSFPMFLTKDSGNCNIVRKFTKWEIDNCIFSASRTS